MTQRLAADSTGSIDRHSGRHFYDVYHLLGDQRILDLLADRHQTEHVLRSVEDINRSFFGGDGLEVRPSGGFANCPAFDPRSAVSTRLRAAYAATMPELYFGSVHLPTWEQIGDRVNEQHTLL